MSGKKSIFKQDRRMPLKKRQFLNTVYNQHIKVNSRNSSPWFVRTPY
ncbi:hypothetical protein HMPREF9554_01254 [Treponema phagedenis F0421]|nr:hypothetical protein HMPREF9554_01254 [Treponema phagedenis F0421]